MTAKASRYANLIMLVLFLLGLSVMNLFLKSTSYGTIVVFITTACFYLIGRAKTNVKYAYFTKSSSSKKDELRLHDYLQYLSVDGNGTSITLLDILKFRKVRLIWFSMKSQPEIKLIMIKGQHDDELIKLGKSYNFPRGFPILMTPTGVKTFGFYPKFDNDDLRATHPTFIVNDVEELTFFKKFSGFLGMMLAFEHNGTFYWTITSKNCAGNDYSCDAKRIITRQVTPRLLKKMIDDNICLSFEVMSSYDQTHGSRVLQETCVLTCVGKGHVITTDKIIHVTELITCSNPEEVNRFAHKYGLSVDKSTTLLGENARTFLNRLIENRDYLCDDKFEEILQEVSAQIIPGTISHDKILTILEGLVIHVRLRNGSKMTWKFKFQEYVIRTMFLRQLLEDRVLLVSKSTIKKLDTHLDRWSTTDAGKAYWKMFGLLCLKYFYEDMSRFTTGNVATHIQVADYVKNHLKEYCPTLEEVEKDYLDLVRRRTKATIILFAGAVGVGKSSWGRLFSDMFSNTVYIDGDALTGFEDCTMNMGAERNPTTIWLLVKAILDGKVPVLSTGGGALLNGFGKKISCNLRSKIHEFLPDIEVSIQLFHVGQHDSEKVKRTLLKRLHTNEGSWSKESIPNYMKASSDKGKAAIIRNFINNLAKQSQFNVEKVIPLLEEIADDIYCLPSVDPEEGQYKKFIKQMKFPKLDFKMISFPEKWNPYIQQVRLILKVSSEEKMRHVTVSFNKDRNHMKYSDFLRMKQNFQGKSYKGQFYSREEKGNKIRLVVMPESDIHEDNCTHVTISSGKHRPAEMKKIAMALYHGNKSVDLLTKTGTTVTYDISEFKQVQDVTVTAKGLIAL